MTNEEADLLLDRAKFGIEVERFLASPIGRYIEAKAQKESNAAISKMKTVDVGDVAACREIQESLNIPDKIMYWLAEAKEEGEVCGYMLKRDGK